VQIPLHTLSSAETYIAEQEWRGACLSACPLHPDGGCGIARHGSYARVTPQGLRVARWYCRQGHRTFSLLPDFLAARFPGLLASIEVVVATASSAPSVEAAACALRDLDVTLPSAVRWLRRRLRAVYAGLAAVQQWVASLPATSLVTCAALQADLGPANVLMRLRRSVAPNVLQTTPAPLGFLPSRGGAHQYVGSQHEMGPDEERAKRYVVATNTEQQPCEVRSLIRSRRSPFRRPRTCSASGVPTAACRTAAQALTCCG